MAGFVRRLYTRFAPTLPALSEEVGAAVRGLYDDLDLVFGEQDDRLDELEANSGSGTVALTGDVTGTGTGSFATTIAAGAVTLAKMADIATDRLIGRDSTSTGVPEALTVGGGLEFTGSGGIQRSALTGDVTASAGNNATTIASAAVTLAKHANLAANSVIGNSTGSSATPTAVSMSSTAATSTVPITSGSSSQLDKAWIAYGSPADGQVPTWDATNSRVVFASPGDYPGWNQWVPDFPPAAPSAYDDEFSGSGIDAKWTEWDPAGCMTGSIDNKHLCLEYTSNGTIRKAGYFQAKPGTEFAFYAKVDVICQLGSTTRVGIMFGQDLTNNPSTSDIETAYMAVGASGAQTSTGCFLWGQYNSSTATSRGNTPNNRGDGSLYLRGRMNGTALAMDVSGNGRTWIQLASWTCAFTPAEFGVYTDSEAANGRVHYAFFKFVRVFEGAGTSAINGTRIGKYV